MPSGASVTKVIQETKSPRIVIADDTGLIYSDDWRRGWLAAFRELGCYTMTVDIAQLRRLISAGPFSVRGSTITAALADTIAGLKPDLVWCHHGRAAGNDAFLARLRRRGIRTAVYLCDEPYECGETSRYSPKFDYVFSMDYETVALHKACRPFGSRGNVFYLPPCADAQLFKRENYEARNLPAFFLGNPTLIPREQFLRKVEKEIPGADIRYWPRNGKPVAKGNAMWINAEDHPKWYSRAVVGLNIHRHPGITKECFKTRILNRPKQLALALPSGFTLPTKMPEQEGTGFWNDYNLPASHINPRAFEFFACGTLVVSDDTRLELARTFPFSPRAKDPEHFVELVRYYNENKIEAEEIGRVCSALVSRRHTYKHRVFEVLTRLGLHNRVRDDLASSLGEPADYLTPQDFEQLKEMSSSEQIGPSERWSPASGLLLMRMYGDPKKANSLSLPPPVLPF
jgi:spore maturation protein CgeB